MRLAFSVAINVDADILLIDEILAVGDQHFQQKCYNKLKELKASGKTIVIVTHSLDVVKDMCDRAVWIYKGEFRLDGDPIYVIDEYLKQVAIDHKEEKKKAIASGFAKHKGVIFIDLPKDFSNISKDNNQMLCRGWQISDCEDAKLCILLDGNEITSIQRTKRQDVFDAYQEDFAGFIDVDSIGWETQIDLNLLNLGLHYLDVQCLKENDEVLADKSIQFTLV